MSCLLISPFSGTASCFTTSARRSSSPSRLLRLFCECPSGGCQLRLPAQRQGALVQSFHDRLNAKAFIAPARSRKAPSAPRYLNHLGISQARNLQPLRSRVRSCGPTWTAALRAERLSESQESAQSCASTSYYLRGSTKKPLPLARMRSYEPCFALLVKTGVHLL